MIEINCKHWSKIEGVKHKGACALGKNGGRPFFQFCRECEHYQGEIGLDGKFVNKAITPDQVTNVGRDLSRQNAGDNNQAGVEPNPDLQNPPAPHQAQHSKWSSAQLEKFHACWEKLHTATKSNIDEAIKFTRKNIPCGTCKHHFLEHLTQNPIENLFDEISVFKWTVDLHNIVNQKNGEAKWDYKAAREIWRPHKTDAPVFVAGNMKGGTSAVAAVCNALGWPTNGTRVEPPGYPDHEDDEFGQIFKQTIRKDKNKKKEFIDRTKKLAIKRGQKFCLKRPRASSHIQAIREALPDIQIINVNRPIEKINESIKRSNLNVKGRLAEAQNMMNQRQRAVAGVPHVNVDFEQLRRNPRQQVLRIAAYLGVNKENKIREAISVVTQPAPEPLPKIEWAGPPVLGMQEKVSILLPYIGGQGGDDGSFELRHFLRSVDYHLKAEIENIIIVGANFPDWLQNVVLIDCPKTKQTKPRPRYKNINRAVIMAANNPRMGQQFVYANDDTYFINPTSVECLRQPFSPTRWLPGQINHKSGNVWQKYIKHTASVLFTRKVKQAFDFDTHTPEVFEKLKFKQMLDQFPVQKDGLAIQTLYHNIFKPDYDPLNSGWRQMRYRIQANRDWKKINHEVGRHKIFNHTAKFDDQLKQFLSERFPKPSRYEKQN